MGRCPTAAATQPATFPSQRFKCQRGASPKAEKTTISVFVSDNLVLNRAGCGDGKVEGGHKKRAQHSQVMRHCRRQEYAIVRLHDVGDEICVRASGGGAVTLIRD